MGRMIDHAVAGAGLDGLRAELPRRLASGGTLSEAERVALEAADLLVVGALADEVRQALAGDRVRLLGSHGVAPPTLTAPGETGMEILRRIAMARLSGRAPVAVDLQSIGLHVAQVALGFGADTWIVGPGARRSLTGMSVDLDALVRRAGRIPEWAHAEPARAEVAP